MEVGYTQKSSNKKFLNILNFLIFCLFFSFYNFLETNEITPDEILKTLNLKTSWIKTLQFKIKLDGRKYVVKYSRPNKWKVEDEKGNLILLQNDSGNFTFENNKKIIYKHKKQFLLSMNPYLPITLIFYLEPETYFKFGEVFLYERENSYFILFNLKEVPYFLMVELNKINLKIEKIICEHLKEKIISERKMATDLLFSAKIGRYNWLGLEIIEVENIRINPKIDEKQFLFSVPENFLVYEYMEDYKEENGKEKESPEYLFNKGISFLRKREYNKALSYLEKLKKLKPDAPFLYICLSYLNWKINNLKGIIENLEKYISLNPDWFEARDWNDVFSFLDYMVPMDLTSISQEKTELAEYILKNMKNKLFAYNISGDIFSQANAYEKAIICYEKAIKFDKRRTFYLEKISQILENLQEIEKAISIIDELIKSQPDNPEFYYRKARLLLKSGKIEEAEKYFEECLKKTGFTNKKLKYFSFYMTDLLNQKQYEKAENYILEYMKLMENFEIYFSINYQLISKIYANLGNIEKKIKEMEEKIKNKSGNFYDYLLLISLYIEKKEWKKVNEYIIECIPQYPEIIFFVLENLHTFYTNEFPGDLLIQIYLKTKEIFSGFRIFPEDDLIYYIHGLGNKERVMEILEKIAEKDKNFVYRIEGKLLFEMGMYSESIEKLKEALIYCKNKKEESEIRYYLAIALEKTGKINEAIGEYEEFLEEQNLLPNKRYLEITYRKIPELYAKQGKLDELEKKLEKELNGKSLPKYRLLGEVYLKKAEVEKLEDLCNKGMDLFPEEYFFAWQLAKIYFNKDYKKSLEIINRSLKGGFEVYKDNFSKNMLEMKCHILKKEKDFDALAVLLEQIKSYEKKYFYLLAEIYQEQGKIEKAENIYKGLLNINEKDRKAMLGLADIYLRKKEIEKAENLYKKIIEYNNSREISQIEKIYYGCCISDNKVLKPNPLANYLPYYGLAECYLYKKEFTKVLEILEKILVSCSNREIREKFLSLLDKIPENLKSKFLFHFKYPLKIPEYSLPGYIKFVDNEVAEIFIPYKSNFEMKDKIEIFSEDNNLLFTGEIYLLTSEIFRIKIESKNKTQVKKNQKVYILRKPNKLIFDDFKGEKINEDLWEIFAIDKPFMNLEKKDGKILIEGISSREWRDTGIRSKFQSDGHSFIVSMNFKVLWGDPLVYLMVNGLTLAFGAEWPYQIIMYNPFLNTGPVIEKFGDEDRIFHNLSIRYDNKTKIAICYIDGFEIGRCMPGKESSPFVFSVEPNIENALLGVEITDFRIEFLD
jgi:tetratricopeptide (TPR) repeat protein